MTIDAHHHFWKYDPVEYDWIDESMSLIRRDFLPADLRREIATAGVDGVISVQARQSIEETRWLLDLADQIDFIRGVVGWLPLISPEIAKTLEEFAANKKLKSLRHVLQGEADDRYMLRPDFNAGIQQLRRHNLAYDILIFERQLPQTFEFVDRHPSQTFILDHVGKPRIRAGELAPWNKYVRELARRDNVYCKISGMVTEADHKTWTPTQLKPYFDVALEAFGPRRLLFGSDWPVCLVASGYVGWAAIVRGWIVPLSVHEQNAIMGETARRAYRL